MDCKMDFFCQISDVNMTSSRLTFGAPCPCHGLLARPASIRDVIMTSLPRHTLLLNTHAHCSTQGSNDDGSSLTYMYGLWTL